MDEDEEWNVRTLQIISHTSNDGTTEMNTLNNRFPYSHDSIRHEVSVFSQLLNENSSKMCEKIHLEIILIKTAAWQYFTQLN